MRYRFVSARRKPRIARCPGHWEGDLLAGSANTHIATLVERQTRYVMLVKVDGKDTATVVDALAQHVRNAAATTSLEQPYVGSRHGARRSQAIPHRHRCRALFLRPSGSLAAWDQREHQWSSAPVLPEENRSLMPQQADLDAVAHRLNTRPRKTLSFETPANRFAAIGCIDRLNSPRLFSDLSLFFEDPDPPA
jgi:hypothetical protein